MPVTFPADLTAVQVRASYATFDGTALAGTVTFTPSIAWVVDPASGVTVLTRPIVGQVTGGVLLNAAGSGPLALYATDDPDATPSGWTYNVAESFTGVPGRPPYNLSVPVAAAANGLDLWTVAPTAPATTPAPAYVLLPAFTNLSAQVAALTTQVAALTASAATMTLTERAVTSNYTVTAGDVGNVVLHCTAAGPVTITLPSGVATEAAIPWRQWGGGQITFAPGGGMALVSRGLIFHSAGQYAEGVVTAIDSTTWLLTGDIA